MIKATKMIEFKNGVEELNEEEISFIENELGITPDQISQFNDDELNDKVYEPMCDIEIEEAPADDDTPETDRCQMASHIVTVLGNSLAEYNGWIEEA